MPLVTSTYRPPHVFKNGHFSTIYSSVFRRVACVQQRERLLLSDGDFMDLDWSYAPQRTDRLIVILHGLEGNAQRPYVTGTANIFNENGYDACAVNFRSCSGETNKGFSSYHSGRSDDLDEVLRHIIEKDKYTTIVLKGFSLGANVVLKYCGERSTSKEIKAAIAVSVPCYLYGSMLQLHKRYNIIYHQKFKQDLIGKLKQKQVLYPELITNADIARIKTLRDFDEVYTSRAHSFKNALDYYEKSSSLPFLSDIKIPVLIINARNDSFLSPECYPVAEAEKMSNLFLDRPEYGGHVGFYERGKYYYNEKKSIQFIRNVI